MDEPDSFNNVAEKWHPELAHYCPNVPIVLAGTKIDLRDDKEITKRLARAGETPITKEKVSLPLDNVTIKFSHIVTLVRARTWHKRLEHSSTLSVLPRK